MRNSGIRCLILPQSALIRQTLHVCSPVAYNIALRLAAGDFCAAPYEIT